MKKKLVSVMFFMMVMAVMMFPTTAYADIGPKASVVVDFIGLEDEVYYTTLLSEEISTGPYSFSDEPINQEHWLVEDDKEYGELTWQALLYRIF